jgi:thioredoxin 1
MSTKEATDATFTEMTHQGIVIAELGAAWCGPCKMIAPALEEIDQDSENKISVVQLDVDQNPKTAQHYGVMSIPTLLFFKDGDLKETTVGFKQKEEILSIAGKHT